LVADKIFFQTNFFAYFLYEKKLIIMTNSNRMFDIRALGGFKSNDMGFEDFVKNVAKSGVSVGNAYMGKVSFAGHIEPMNI
jgi:hypothetical protein